MGTFTVWQVPAFVIACLGIVALFIRVGRKDKTLEDHTQTIKEHGKLLKQCADKKLLTEDDCKSAQGRCMQTQTENNTAIMQNISDLRSEVRDNREGSHTELMKIAKSVGRIEGVISRLRFNKDGELI